MICINSHIKKRSCKMKMKTIKIGLIIFALSFSLSSLIAQTQNSKKIGKIFVNMESHSEDMLDAVAAKNMKQLNNLYSHVKEEMKALNQANDEQIGFNLLTEQQTKSLAMENSWFSLITLEMKERDDLPALANAINQFTGELIILTNYKKNYRTDVAWLDYLGREIMLLNQNYPNELRIISIRKTDLQKTWKRVRKSLRNNKNNLALISKTDLLISNILKTHNSTKLVKLAKQELDIVDEIEKAFNIG